MFHHLHGILLEKSPTHAIIECGGVGYFVHISLTTYTALHGHEAGASSLVKVLVHAVYREDAQLLYGFMTAQERAVFLLLLSVSGVGANTARMILSSLTSQEAIQAIASGNSGLLQSIKGIGTKTAQRLVVDLRDKVGRISGGTALDVSKTELGSTNGVRSEAVAALEVLGFPKPAVEKVVSTAMGLFPEAPVEDIVKWALGKL